CSAGPDCRAAHPRPRLFPSPTLFRARRPGEAGTAPAPHEIVVSRDGRTAVVSEYGHREPGHTLGVYDAHTGRLLRRVDLGTHTRDRKGTRLNSSHVKIWEAV